MTTQSPLKKPRIQLLISVIVLVIVVLLGELGII